MAKRILVPLDGTSTAASVLELVADAARGAGSRVRLLRVVPVPDSVVDADGRVIAYADQERARLESEALDDLTRLERQLPDVAVEHVVRFGDVVDEILRGAELFGADLIALSTRSKSVVARAILGSVAEQVFRKTDIAVLLYRHAAAVAA